MTDIERIKELLPKITHGEWHYQEQSDAYTHIIRSDTNMYICGGSQGRAEENLRFIALARNVIGPLLDAVDRLETIAYQAWDALHATHEGPRNECARGACPLMKRDLEDFNRPAKETK